MTPSSNSSPIPLSAEQEQAIKDWAADDRLWTTQETVEHNLRTFARVILKLQAPKAREHEWQFYANGTFCRRCGASIGDPRPCR